MAAGPRRIARVGGHLSPVLVATGPGKLYALTNDAPYRSTDTGESWEPLDGLDWPERYRSQHPQALAATIEKEEDTGATNCTHLDQIRDVEPSAQGCEDCLRTGDSWVHLRECLTCGHVGCCDSSKNKHATEHFHASAHPIVASFEPGGDWMWCYVDEVVMASR